MRQRAPVSQTVKPAPNLSQRTPPSGETEAAPVDKSEAENKLSEWNNRH
jgi:hypothetical protein